MDSDFSFDNIYDGNEFSEGSPMKKKGAPNSGLKPFGGAGGTPSGNNSPATVPAAGSVKTPQQENMEKRRTSLGIFSWGSSKKEKETPDK
jgi:hypothetical protein